MLYVYIIIYDYIATTHKKNMKGVKSEVMKYVKLACIVDQLLGLAVFAAMDNDHDK
jgi:hypothetical protein